MLVDVCAMEFDVMAAESIADGMITITRGRRPDIVLCDLMMPDGGADEWLKLCGEKFPELADRTVIITGRPATARDGRWWPPMPIAWFTSRSRSRSCARRSRASPLGHSSNVSREARQRCGR